MKEKIINELLDKYELDCIVNIADITASNAVFIGKKQEKQSIVIKAFTSTRLEKYHAEEKVLKIEFPHLFVDGFIDEETNTAYLISKFIPQLTKKKMADYSLEDIKKSAQELVKYHKLYSKFQADDFKSIGNIVDKLTQKAQSINLGEYKEQISALLEEILTHAPEINQEINDCSKVLVHGDFCDRNIHFNAKQEALLLDFELSRIGLAFEDFIKPVYIQMNKEQAKVFIQEYSKENKLTISLWLWKALLLSEVLGIISYAGKNDKPHLLDFADKLLGYMQNWEIHYNELISDEFK